MFVALLDKEAQEDLRANKNLDVYKGALYENIVGEALSKSDGFEFILQLGDKNFSVNLKSKLNLPLESGQRTEIPVKINSTGKIVPDLFLLKGQTDSVKEEVTVTTKETFNHKSGLS